MSKNFFMGSQAFEFVEQVDDAHGRSRDVFRFECAICRGQATVSLPRGASSSHSRRCAKHRMPRVMLGSKAEAVIVTAMGWPVADGSVLHEMREEGSAWVVSELKLVAPVVLRRDSGVTGSSLEPSDDEQVLRASVKERAMLAALVEIGPADAQEIVVNCGAPANTVRVVASRLLAKRMVKKEANVWSITARGLDTLRSYEAAEVAPRLALTLVESDDSDGAVLSLFD